MLRSGANLAELAIKVIEGFCEDEQKRWFWLVVG
jgi:hypothetical protein